MNRDFLKWPTHAAQSCSPVRFAPWLAITAVRIAAAFDGALSPFTDKLLAALTCARRPCFAPKVSLP
jgi:hypothetical protein